MVAEVIEGGVLCRARRDTLYTHEHGQPGRVRTPLLTDCCRPEATRNPPISPITRQNKKTKSEREIREEKGVSLSISSIVRLPFLQQTLSKLWQRKQKTESPSREAFYFVTDELAATQIRSFCCAYLAEDSPNGRGERRRCHHHRRKGEKIIRETQQKEKNKKTKN